MAPSRERTYFIIVAIVAAVFVAVLIAVPLFVPVDPNATDLSNAYCAPGEDGHLLGTDSVGRDLLMRTLFGGSESVLMAFAIVAIALVVGTVVGLVSGLAGGVVDEVIDKVITMFQAFPSLVLAIAIAAILGQGVVNMIIAVVVVKWTEFARLARSLALSLKSSDSVKAARVCGAGFGAIARKYLLPNMTSPLVVMAALSVGDAVLTMAGLSFLGLGPGRPTNEWGAMMSEGMSSFQFAPWCILVPGFALFIAVTIFNLLGDTLRDALDARTRRVVADARGGGWGGFLRRRQSAGVGDADALAPPASPDVVSKSPARPEPAQAVGARPASSSVSQDAWIGKTAVKPALTSLPLNSGGLHNPTQT